jgi:hypothetical protein
VDNLYYFLLASDRCRPTVGREAVPSFDALRTLTMKYTEKINNIITFVSQQNLELSCKIKVSKT